MPDRPSKNSAALSSRVKRWMCFFSFLSVLFPTPVWAQDRQVRPKITGIEQVRIYVADINKSRDFYSKLFGVRLNGGMCFETRRTCFVVGWVFNQTIELEQAPTGSTKNWLAKVVFATDNIGQMHSYLVAHGVAVGNISEDPNTADRKHPYAAHFELRDPEGTEISFIQRYLVPIDDPPFGIHIDTIGERILHAGFVVNNIAAENRFYRDLLGFRLYWQGGFKDDGLDWYEIQVPDGESWIEYMLNIPAGADHKELGVQNHFSLGVKDVHVAAEELRKKGLTRFDGPEIGRDGKWSIDIYDPDGTRVEIMEFTPAKEPCCHPYTAPHPKP